MSTAPDPSQVSQHVQSMRAQAALCNALMGGTKAMRDAGTKYLPQDEAESEKAWEIRRDRTFLFNEFGKTVDRLVGLPLSEDIVVGEDVPTAIKPWLEDVDLQGRDLECFSRDVFRQSLVDGLGFILVDYPMVRRPLTLADERTLNLRPFWVHVPLERFLGYRAERINSQWVLTQARIFECFEVQGGDFGTTLHEQVRVLEPGMVSVYVKTKTADAVSWVLDPEQSGPVTLKVIPLVPVYTGRTAFMAAEPPLADLAWKNLEHWQSSSDQRNILHYTRSPLLFGKNLVHDTATKKLVIGPRRLIQGTGAEADLKYVIAGHEGAAAGSEDLKNIEDQMRRMAGELLARQASNVTAKEVGVDASQNGANLLAMVDGLEDALEQALNLSAAWVKLPSGGSLKINREWDDPAMDPQELVALGGLRQAGEITRETLLWNLDQAGKLPPGTVIADEVQRLQEASDSITG